MTDKQNITAILENYFAGYKDEIIDRACNRILNQEPKTGHWIECEDEVKCFCSECKEISDYPTKFCPNCGARMEREENHEPIR